MRKILLIYLLPTLLFSGTPYFIPNLKVNNLKVETKLTANGLIYPQTDGTNNQAIITDGSGNLSFATISGSGYWDLNTGLIYPSNLSYKVGVGTNTPIRFLHVVDGVSSYPARFSGGTHTILEIFANGAYQAGFRLGDGTTNYWYWDYYGNDASKRLRIRDSTTTEVFTLLHGGNVGIGTSSPTTTLDVAGGIYADYTISAGDSIIGADLVKAGDNTTFSKCAPGDANWTTSSSRRLKNVGNPLNISFEDFMKIRAFEWYFKKSVVSSPHLAEKLHYGPMAEDFAIIYGDGKTIDHEKAFWALWNVTQKLVQRTNELENIINRGLK